MRQFTQARQFVGAIALLQCGTLFLAMGVLWAHRRYADAAVALSKAFALAAASDEARSIREEVGFFQAIRAALIKSVPSDGKKSTAERELAIQQIVRRAVVSTEIVDIMKAAGLESPDISILSDEFLAEVRDTDKKRAAGHGRTGTAGDRA